VDASLEAGSAALWQFDYAMRRAVRVARSGAGSRLRPSRDTGAKFGTNRDKSGQRGQKAGQTGTTRDIAGHKWDSLAAARRPDFERSLEGKPQFSSGFPKLGITRP